MCVDVYKRQLLINAAECEPYLTPDVREILEDSENVIEGMKMVAKLLDVKNAVIGIEDNKPEAIKLMTERLAQVKIDGINFKMCIRDRIEPYEGISYGEQLRWNCVQ